ncbi:MAG: DNA-directed RNA polymerase subunit RpoH/Rpb5 C-terminal domain-containing protein [Candidatus Neomarinimicrobiota bacterium]
MSSTSYSPLISKIYKSRNIILNILKSRGFNVDDWSDFSVTEVQAMFNSKELDMLLENPTTKKKVYVKYHLSGTKGGTSMSRLGTSHIYDYVDDLFDIEEVLTSNDDLIIISKDKTNQTIKDLIEQLFIKDKKFVNIYNFHDYLFNVLEHEMQPKFRILSEEEKQKIMKQYNITKDKEFPDISRFDPVSQAIGVRPGEVMEITRSSPTAVKSVYFRICY